MTTLLEVLLVFADIPLYIRRWQYTYPQAWLPLLAVILLSHIAHGDAPGTLGLTSHELCGSAELVLALVVTI